MQKKASILTTAVAVASGFTAIGGALLMWEDLRPWTTRAEKKALELRICKISLAIIQGDLFRAQQNEFEAQSINNEIVVFQSKQAQEFYREQYAQEKKACDL